MATLANTGANLPVDGESYDTWGEDVLAFWAIVDKAFGNVEAIATTGGSTSLTQSQSNAARLNVTGTLASNATIAPLSGVKRFWIVTNNTSGAYSVTLKIGAGAGAAVTQGKTAIVHTDGTDCFLVDFSTLGGQVPTAGIADNAITSAKLASGAALANLADGSVTSAKLADNGVPLAKLATLANMRVIGNVSGSTATPAAVTVIDDDTMATASATTLATSESIKNFVAATAFSSALPAQSGNAGKYVTTDGTNASWADVTAVLYRSYANRGQLRAIEGPADTMALVEGLGLFVWVSGATGPDDGETSFATATGAWYLHAASWDVAFAYWLADIEVLYARLGEARDNIRRVLVGSATSTATSISSLAEFTFTGTVTGAEPGDAVIVTPPGALAVNLAFSAWASASNTITISVRNPSASTASSNVGAGVWRVAVIKETTAWAW